MSISFDPAPSVEEFGELRRDVRAHMDSNLGSDFSNAKRAHSWLGFDAAFSRSLGKRGWVGMTLPKKYGGHERTAMERYVVMEELLAAGAPVFAHWVADRQSAPLLLHYGTEEQRLEILPRIAAGECCFCIGMSEPNSGSDLAAAQTRATRKDEGYCVNGTKLWTTNAHKAHYMTLLARTDKSDERHGGMSQFLVDMRTPGIEVRPIIDLAGEHEFNEVRFDDVLLPPTALLGNEGDGWKQVMGELAFERSGPERFLSSFALLNELVRVLSDAPDRQARQAIGRLLGHLMVLRHMSQSVAGMLQRGENPTLQATIVKDLGTIIEQEIPEIARTLVKVEGSLESADTFAATFARTLLAAPSFSLRGGTREILRGIIARGLGLR
ncbi:MULTISPECIES: acyl-CoA dehydrogenase family protein [unclassified Mesorhizobium]|uniref:acyl-CoA dehydrogenase family protein n=1 Tax=unclassified Mesorhizobium TaxID=325217 RepID=UPI001125F8C0|nr:MULTISPECIES: acyl-CoA dehydrogenase family protein [unclassified Mesorhizobium]TPL00753.1 acyl-CoA dehydrogenase [Mesorhizobium sp. B2-4-16]TPL76986.1 acyl-CoA dehydrogenase [Mesorhizobium sp. B2-4-3]